MKTTTLTRKLLNILAVTTFILTISAVNASAADNEKKEAVQLDEHHAIAGVTCADCHGEGNERKKVTIVTCMECHDTNELAEKTAEGYPTNPHKNRHYNTEADCNLCHHQHKKSTNFCLPCHARFDFQVP